jgi:hypothetical protein
MHLSTHTAQAADNTPARQPQTTPPSRTASYGVRWTLERGPPERYCARASSRDDFGGGSGTSKGRCDLANISASLPNAGWLTVHARRHQREVCPVSRGVMWQPLSGLLPAGLCLFPPPLAATLSGPLTIPLAVREQQDNGLTTFRRWNKLGGVGRVSSPVVQHLRWRSSEPPDLTTCLLAQACQPLWLVLERFTMALHTHTDHETSPEYR